MYSVYSPVLQGVAPLFVRRIYRIFANMWPRCRSDQEDDELRFDNPSRLSLLRYNPSPGCILGSDSRDNDSVNHAISSILDMERGAVQTPDDLRSLTGLLDPMESDTQNQEAQNAVNSIL